MTEIAEPVCRWRCPVCDSVLEESDQGALYIAQQMHKRTCSPPTHRVNANLNVSVKDTIMKRGGNHGKTAR